MLPHEASLLVVCGGKLRDLRTEISHSLKVSSCTALREVYIHLFAHVTTVLRGSTEHSILSINLIVVLKQESYWIHHTINQCSKGRTLQKEFCPDAAHSSFGCLTNLSKESFSVICSGRKTFDLTVKEAFLIKIFRPSDFINMF